MSAIGVRCLSFVVACVGLSLLANVSVAQRPVAPKLLPDTTLAYLRVADTPQLIERFRETSIGRIGQDEEIKPLVSQLYGTLEKLWAQVETQVGVPLDQLLRIPQGEICVAFIASKEGPVGAVAFIDVKDQMYTVKKLLERGEEALIAGGGTKTTEQIEGQDVHTYTGPEGPLYQFEKEGTFVLATNKDLIKPLLVSWTGGSEAKALADNEKFNSVMNRCKGAVDDPPQFTWYVDPIEIARTAARGNSGAQTFLALLPVMGLDGFKAVGGSLTFATGEFDSVSHMHYLLESPRSGVLDMIAFGSGSVEPEQWVPADAATYTTMHWNLQHTYDKAGVLYNSLMGEGELQKEVQARIGTYIGVDFEKEVLPALDGRMTTFRWIDKSLPPGPDSQATVMAARLKDVQAFEPTFAKMMEKFQESLAKKNFAGNIYYSTSLPPKEPEVIPENESERDRARRERRASGPQAVARWASDEFFSIGNNVAILGDYIVFTNREGALRKMVMTASEPGTSLASELDFKLIASKIKRQNGGDAPAMLSFNRPEEGIKFLYELAGADNTRTQLARGAEQDEFLKGVEQAMKDNPLPPFSVIAQYLAPGGGMITSDETGVHYSSFTLRRK